MIMEAQLAKKIQSSSTSIEDLADESLTEIFLRLPSHESVITCKFVSKRWSFVLSNPRFVVDFLNHKKIQIQSKKAQLPWSFLCTMKLKPMMTSSNDDDDDDEIPNHKVFNSPKFTLNFLPFPFKIVATFKDLILCENTGISNVNDDNRYYHNYYVICNPVTKQWLALPPTPPLNDNDNNNDKYETWASLICEEPYFNGNEKQCDYRFRVVVVYPKPKGRHLINHLIRIFKLMVFCSESCVWKFIDLSVAIDLITAKRNPPYALRAPFVGVVCNGMVCIRHNPYFGMFNPFDVTANTTSGSTVEAIMLPRYPSGDVMESGGSLVVVFRSMFSSKPGPIALILRSFEKDLKNIALLPQCWRDYCIGKCIGNEYLPLSTVNPWIIGMHPSNKQLLYVLTGNNEVVLCDLGSKCLKVLGTLDPNHLELQHRLQLQYWPTPLPSLHDQ